MCLLYYIYNGIMALGMIGYKTGWSMKRERRFLKDNGFTLVELIIAIAIMAILAGAIGLAVIHYIRKARASNATEELRTIVTAVETGFLSTYAEDHQTTLDKTYTDRHDDAHSCGILTNWMISRAQNKSQNGITEANELEYYFAQKVLEELGAENGSQYPFFNFTGDEDEPLGMNCKAFYNEFGCPGVIVVYGDEGKVLFAQYYNYGCLIEYNVMDGYSTLDGDTFVGAPTIR